MRDTTGDGPAELELVTERCAILADLLRNDRRFAFVGRGVSLAGDRPDGPDLVGQVAHLTGFASAHFIPADRWPAYEKTLSAAGLIPVRWSQLIGRAPALDAAREFLNAFSPPGDLRLCAVGPDTDDATLSTIRKSAFRAGVTPPIPSVMRGSGPPGVILYVTTPDGQVVASGGGFLAYANCDGHETDAFWGMLATSETWRGKRLASWVGAETILRLADNFGATSFSSGVKPDNAPSQAMCARLGLRDENIIYAGATNPRLLGNTPITR